MTVSRSTRPRARSPVASKRTLSSLASLWATRVSKSGTTSRSERWANRASTSARQDDRRPALSRSTASVKASNRWAGSWKRGSVTARRSDERSAVRRWNSPTARPASAACAAVAPSSANRSPAAAGFTRPNSLWRIHCAEFIVPNSLWWASELGSEEGYVVGVGDTQAAAAARQHRDRAVGLVQVLAHDPGEQDLGALLHPSRQEAVDRVAEHVEGAVLEAPAVHR